MKEVERGRKKGDVNYNHFSEFVKGKSLSAAKPDDFIALI